MAESVYTTETPSSNATLGANFSVGNDIVFAVAGQVTGLRYHRRDASQTINRYLKIWQGPAPGTLLGSVAMLHGTGTSGWVTGTLATPVTVTAGTTLRVSLEWTENTAVNRSPNFAANIVNGSLTLLKQGYTGTLPGTPYPDTINANTYFVDVVFQRGPLALTTETAVASSVTAYPPTVAVVGAIAIPTATVTVSAPSPTLTGRYLIPTATVAVGADVPTLTIPPRGPTTLDPGTARTRYGVDLRVQLGIGRQEGRGVWDAGIWDFATWGQPDTELGDWVDVTCDVEDPFKLQAGASDADGVVTRWEAATCYFTLWGATWDPWAGPYAGIVGPGVGVRVLWRPTIANDGDPWEHAFRGSIAADGYEWHPSATHDSVQVSAVDATEILVAYEAVDGDLVGDGDIASARVARILDVAEWPDDADHRDILTGGIENQPTNLGGVAWEQLLITADTDLGILWFNRAGTLCYRPTGRTGENVRDAGALAVCATPGAHQVVTMGGAQPTDVKNIVTIGRADIPTDPTTEAPPPTTVRAEGSIARYRSRRYERTDLTHQDDAWSAIVAGAILGTSAFPAAAPRNVDLDSRMRDPTVPRLLLSVEPDQAFDVHDRIGQVWRETVTGWDVQVGIGHIEGTIVLNDITRWAAGHWDDSTWDTDHWGFLTPAERRRRHGHHRT
jgi:hypothetical protein